MQEKQARTGQAKLSRRYGVAVAAIAGAVAVRWLLNPVLPTHAPYVTFYLAVLVTSVYGGLGPAVLTTVSGALAAVYWFVEPRFSLRLGTSGDAVWLAFYLLVCGSIALAVEAQARAARLAQSRLAELQAEQERRAGAELETERQRRWAAQALSSIGDGVIITDAQRRITFLNSVASKLTGWSSEEAAGQPVETVFRVIDEQTGEEAEGPVERALREGRAVGLANHTALIRKEGTQLPIDDSGAPIRDLDGIIVGAVLVFRDYTERRRNDENNARLAEIVRYSGEAIISKTLDGTIRTWNPAAEKLFGYTAEEAIGRPINILIPPGREHEESAVIETLRSGRTIEQFETVRRRKDGVEVQVSITLSPLYDAHGVIVGASHIARDLTAQKELNAQLLQSQKLESLGVLAGGVAHDFNNLLTGIIGSGSLLLETLPEGSAEAILAEQVVKAGERAAHLTRQLLAYSGKGRFVVERIDVSAAVGDMVELIRASVPHTTELALDLSADLPPVEVDVTQFQQIVMNLAINGAEAMGGAPGKVTVSTGARFVTAAEIASTRQLSDLQPGEYVSLQVRDTGSGMTAATIAKIFDPFFTTKFAGRGLGLAAVQGIVRGHRGAILVASAPGRGTTFEVLLPAAARRAFVAAPDPGRPTILVVDDEEMVRETARLTLERAGYQILTAEDGQAGVEVFSRNRDIVTLVLLDLTMPALSGKGALERIRALSPDTPVLLFSGYNEDDARRQIDDAAVAGFLKKPFTAAALKAKVAAALSRSRAVAVPEAL